MTTIPRRVRVTLDVDTLDLFNAHQTGVLDGRRLISVLLSGGQPTALEAMALKVQGITVLHAEEPEMVTSTGLVCAVCRRPQFDTPGGRSCENGHGGADGVEP